MLSTSNMWTITTTLVAVIVSTFAVTAILTQWSTQLSSSRDNRAPIVEAGILLPTTAVTVGETVELTAYGFDPDGDLLAYTWSAARGSVNPATIRETSVSYTAPTDPTLEFITLNVSDGNGGSTIVSVEFDVVGVSTPGLILPKQQPLVQILRPIDGAEVGELVLVTGVLTDVPRSASVWLFIQPHRSPLFFPQGPLSLREDDSWSARVALGSGSPEDSGEVFEVLAAIVSKQGMLEIEAYLEAFPHVQGLDFLPEGTVVSSRISLVLNLELEAK